MHRLPPCWWWKLSLPSPAAVHPHRIFFRALDALTVDHTGGRAGSSARRLPTLHIQCVMDALERSVVVPARQVIVHRALRRQVLGQIAPLAARAQYIHRAVDHLAHHHRAPTPAMLGRWDQWPNERPLLVSQIRRITQPVAVVAGAVLGRPHRSASDDSGATERITPVSSRSSRLP